MKKYIGNKSFYKMIFILIIPIMIQQLFISIAGYIDSLMLNGFTPDGIAYNGVYAANRLIFIINFLFMGFAAAASIFTAQYYGARNEDKVDETFRLSIYVSIVLGIIASIFIFIFGHSIIDMFVTNSESRQFGYDYIDIMGYAMIIIAINYSLANSFRSVELPKVAMISSVSGIIINITLNQILIYGLGDIPALGAKGAAIATVSSKVVEFLIFNYIIWFKESCIFHRAFNKLKIELSLFKKFLTRAVPMATNELLWSTGMVILTKFYTYNNDVWLTANGYSQNISDLFFIIFAGLGSGTAVVIGVSLGRGEFEKAKGDMYRLKGLGVMMGLFVGVLMYFTSPYIIQMFNPTDEVAALGISLLRIAAIFAAIYCYNSVTFFTLRAGGDSLRAFLLDQIPTYLVAIPIAMYLGINAESLGVSIVHILIATRAADLIKIFIGDFLLSRGAWLRNLT